jgi:hypothetical protein
MDRSRKAATVSVSATVASPRRAIGGIVVFARPALVVSPTFGRRTPICFPACKVFGFAATVPSGGGITSDCESAALACVLCAVVSLPGCAGLHAVIITPPRHDMKRAVRGAWSIMRIIVGVIGLGASTTALTARIGVPTAAGAEERMSGAMKLKRLSYSVAPPSGSEWFSAAPRSSVVQRRQLRSRRSFERGLSLKDQP